VGRSSSGDKVFYGDDVKDQPDLTLIHPITRGTITDWDAMIELWRYVLKKLDADVTKTSILLTEATCVTTADREKMTSIMFDTFGASKVFLADQSMLSLYASGRKEGTVVSSGYGVTQIMPSNDGFLVREANARIEFGGNDITQNLIKMLPGDVSIEDARKIKESHCYVAVNPSTEEPQEIKHELSNGQSVTLKGERIKCVESFFEHQNIFEAVKNSIAKCSEVTGKDMNILYDVLLVGGNTLFSGMAERFLSELQSVAPAGVNVKVEVAPSGPDGPFIGGSILTCLTAAMESLWITQQDYKDKGPALVHTKCA
jgi:actin-related protein